MIKLKIVSDGTPHGTIVSNADTGEDLKLPIMGIEWSISADGQPAKAKLEITLVELEAIAKTDDLTVNFKQAPIQFFGDSQREKLEKFKKDFEDFITT